MVVVGTAVFVPRTDLDRHSSRGVGATLRKGEHTSLCKITYITAPSRKVSGATVATVFDKPGASLVFEASRTQV